ncbi:MAG: hypothetical protein FH751_09680 [Firmicutes bacterium]|nr:hypothetical protein [Bacillota bacterium]
MNLREKLIKLRGQKKKEETKNTKKQNDLLKGREIKNKFGTCFLIENEYDVNYKHGILKIKDAMEVNKKTINKMCNKRVFLKELKKILYIDTETTGLSSGVGTIAFLIGVGYFKDDKFLIKQYFIRDFNEEKSVLYEIQKILKKFTHLVTYNGKSFDIPLLHGRYIFNNIKSNIKNMCNIDLLHPTRRLFKERLIKCNLNNIEKEILNVKRIDDIEGRLIPKAYFNYLKTSDEKEIVKIMKHNKIDIISMVVLFKVINKLYENPTVNVENLKDLYSLGKIHEKLFEYDTSIDCYLKVLEKSDSEFLKNRCLKQLSFIYKRNKNYKKATKIWEHLIKDKITFELYPYEELAKYHEHKTKNFKKALEITGKGINSFYKFKMMGYKKEEIEKLEYRKRRLLRKLNKNNNKKITLPPL